MRPPEFTGGNQVTVVVLPARKGDASMRPPEFTGGNPATARRQPRSKPGFNEAAGIHRRKPAYRESQPWTFSTRFNEAAGIHRRKRVKDLRHYDDAAAPSFNEAAGIHRRKHPLPAGGVLQDDTRLQ